MISDKSMMGYALQLAAQARGNTSPNPMVGAVIVKDGEIVGKGLHFQAGTPHAEVNALKEAGENARGSTVYVTLEPCSHYGRTPPCTDALIKAGVARVVAAMEDPNPKVKGEGFAKLRAAGITVEIGLLEKEAQLLNEVFLYHIITKRPFVILKTAATLDGKVATHTGASKWITGETARAKVHALRGEHDAVLTGIGTILADDAQLTVRSEAITRQPLRVILDSYLRVPLTAKVLDADAPTMIFTSKDASKEKIAMLLAQGVGVKIVECKSGKLDIQQVLDILGEKKITSVLLEAGPGLVASFFEENIINKWYHFIAPKLFGEGARSFYNFSSVNTPDMARKFNIDHVSPIGDDIMLVLYPKGVD